MTSTDIPQRIHASNRVVIKIGSALVADDVSGGAKTDWLRALAGDIAGLKQQGKDVVIVSSGAIALGRAVIAISGETPPSAIPLDQKQAAAATGQILLIKAFRDAFTAHDMTIAQILLSPHDTENRRAHLNARATMQALMERGIIPVINENDTVSTEEIRFGDNDRLAARVGQMIEADLVMLLSSVDGLYSGNPDKDPDARHIPYIEKIDAAIAAMAGDAPEGISTGGMISKLEAAQMATHAGAAMLIADGRALSPVTALLEGAAKATWFAPAETIENARKRWIRAHVEPSGEIVIDDGAITALRNGKSLLPIGVTRVRGNFARGDAVTVTDQDGRKIAIGLVAFHSEDSKRIAGLKSHELEPILGYAGRSEMIRRDDLVLV